MVEGRAWGEGPWSPRPFVLGSGGLNDFSDLGQNVVGLPDGRFAVVWASIAVDWSGVATEGLGLLQFVDDGGGTAFSSPRIVVESETGGVWSPAIVSDAYGGVVTAFLSTGTGFETNLKIQRIDETGLPLWAGQGIEIAIGGPSRPYLVANGDGGAFACFSGVLGSTGGAFCQHLGGAGGRLWGPKPLAVSLSGNTQRPHGVISDGDGGIIVVWLEYLGDVKEIRAQRITREGVRLWGDLGASVVVTGLADDQFVGLRGIGVAADGAGGVFVAYEDANDVSRWTRSARVLRLDAEGLSSWDLPIPIGTPDSRSTRHSATVSDDAGNVYLLADSEAEFGHRDCRLTRVSRIGGMPWGHAGIKVGSSGCGSGRVDVKDGLIVVVAGSRVHTYESSGRPTGPREGRRCSFGMAAVADVVWSGEPGVAISVWEQHRSGFGVDAVGEVRRLAPPGAREPRGRRP